MTNQTERKYSLLPLNKVTNRYVAFVDIMGFGRLIRESFKEVIKIYEELINSTKIIEGFREDVTIQINSDAFLISSEKLGSMIGVIQGLHMLTLGHDCL